MPETMEELEIIKGTKSPHGYLASPISDNIAEKEDGTLIVVGCPIARTGWQKYAVKDLPTQRAKELGVDTSNPEASIDLYRPESEVFNPEFLASLNGVAITDGHPPEGEFVNPKNFNKYSMGHIQNVRKGTEPLEDGEWPIIADLVISAEPLISKVRNRIAREISLGYDFGIDRDGDRIIQCNMLGNHNAVVPKGRAGDYVRIEDALPDASLAAAPIQVFPVEVSKPDAFLAPVVEVIETPAYPSIVLSPIPPKEKHSVANTKKSWLRSLMGKHLIELARATDADPEKIMDAAEALQEEPVESLHATDAGVNDPESDADRRKAVMREVKAGASLEKMLAKYDEWPKELVTKAYEAAKGKAKDGELPEALKQHEFGKGDDSRAKMHAALDKALDRKKAKDSDVEALKTLLDEFLTEEKTEPEHADDEEEPDVSELEATLKGEDEPDVCEECGLPGEDCECDDEVAPSGEEVMDKEGGPDTTDPDDDEDEGPNEKAQAGDRARAADSAMAVLKMLRPGVARANDRKLNAAFNRALDSVKKTSRASTTTGGYGRFASTARTRDNAPRNPNPDRRRTGDSGGDPITKMQDFYNKAHKGGK